MRVSFASATDKGLRRSVNEDSLAVRDDLGLFLVADGMGGHAAGEVASQAAIHGIVAFVESTVSVSPDQTWPIPFNPAQSVDANRLDGGFRMADRRIASEVAGSSELRGMATTAVAALVSDNRVTLAHVGDSRAYRLRHGQLDQLTRDHSWVEEQIRAGTLTESAARAHPWRNIVTRALSGSEDLNVEIRELTLEPGDRLLLCSDGVFAVLSDDQIGDILRQHTDLNAVCDALITGANDGGGPDNVTAVVLEVHAV
ncbi:MAG: Stp1/IreP family PP2C-type Ser/Thr phosphatase [Acidobacteria bacterium]|nr:Stp1/IreP family PP2C-type Ser/Thr phosphatase [Acidobacteriota bacterium]